MNTHTLTNAYTHTQTEPEKEKETDRRNAIHGSCELLRTRLRTTNPPSLSAMTSFDSVPFRRWFFLSFPYFCFVAHFSGGIGIAAMKLEPIKCGVHILRCVACGKSGSAASECAACDRQTIMNTQYNIIPNILYSDELFRCRSAIRLAVES